MEESKFKDKITAKGVDVTVISTGNDDDFISLTDIARFKNKSASDIVVQNWMRLHNTVEYLGIWEQLYNPNFKPIEFEGFLSKAGQNAFTLSPKQWVEKTNAIGIVSKSGRGGGTYAHKDIAFKFAAWISVEFELYIIKDYQRLKEDENSKISLEWNVKRVLSKVNYKFHTDAIKENLIPPELTARQKSFIYADEADLLNVALFGMTAIDWREKNKDKKGNIRDYATVEQLLVLANLENANGLMIAQDMKQIDRIITLNDMARKQLQTLMDMKQVKSLKLLAATKE